MPLHTQTPRLAEIIESAERLRDYSKVSTWNLSNPTGSGNGW